MIEVEDQPVEKKERPPHRVFAHSNDKGVRLIKDYTRRAVALEFDERPNEETIQKLRASSFKWNTQAQAWLAPADYRNREAGQKLFQEIAGIQHEGRSPF